MLQAGVEEEESNRAEKQEDERKSPTQQHEDALETALKYLPTNNNQQLQPWTCVGKEVV